MGTLRFAECANRIACKVKCNDYIDEQAKINHQKEQQQQQHLLQQLPSVEKTNTQSTGSPSSSFRRDAIDDDPIFVVVGRDTNPSRIFDHNLEDLRARVKELLKEIDRLKIINDDQQKVSNSP
jgi:hypothetical protein